MGIFSMVLENHAKYSSLSNKVRQRRQPIGCEMGRVVLYKPLIFDNSCETLYKNVEYEYITHFWLSLSIYAVPFYIFYIKWWFSGGFDGRKAVDR
jgi:hypothetical protein